MTTKYECDRCHRQFMDRKAVTTVSLRTYNGNGWMCQQYHFCEFCRLIVYNAMSMTMDGSYGGSLKKDDRICRYYDKENDPLFREEKE